MAVFPTPAPPTSITLCPFLIRSFMMYCCCTVSGVGTNTAAMSGAEVPPDLELSTWAKAAGLKAGATDAQEVQVAVAVSTK